MEGAWFWKAPIARGWETTTAVGYRGYNIIGLALMYYVLYLIVCFL